MESESTSFFCDSLNEVEWYNEEDVRISKENPLFVIHVDPLIEGQFQCKTTDNNGKIIWGKGVLNVISKVAYQIISCDRKCWEVALLSFSIFVHLNFSSRNFQTSVLSRNSQYKSIPRKCNTSICAWALSNLSIARERIEIEELETAKTKFWKKYLNACCKLSACEAAVKSLERMGCRT